MSTSSHPTSLVIGQSLVGDSRASSHRTESNHTQREPHRAESSQLFRGARRARHARASTKTVIPSRKRCAHSERIMKRPPQAAFMAETAVQDSPTTSKASLGTRVSLLSLAVESHLREREHRLTTSWFRCSCRLAPVDALCTTPLLRRSEIVDGVYASYVAVFVMDPRSEGAGGTNNRYR